MRGTTTVGLCGLMLIASPLAAQPSERPAPEKPASEKPAPEKPGADEKAPADEEPKPDEAAKDGEEPVAEMDETRRRARAHFSKGLDLVGRSQWAEALIAFEKSAALRSHAVTRYNIAACLRALGRYAEARNEFEQALEDHRREDRGSLPERLEKDTKALIKEIDGLLVKLDVQLSPANAMIAIDGRPLEADGHHAGRPKMLAGTLPAGPGQKAPGPRFTVILNPGAHVITLSRRGFEDAVVNESFAPGTTKKLELQITKLPATLEVKANEPESVVTVDGRDVGFAPVTLSRPGGSYSVSVEKDGFTAYETTASVDPGEVWRVSADLSPKPPELWERWWFWSTLAGSVATVAVTTWFVTRPEPKRPEPDGGGLDWVVYVPEQQPLIAW